MSSRASETDRLPGYSEEILQEIGITLSLTPPGEWGQLALCPGPYGCPPWGHEHSGVTQGGEEMFCSADAPGRTQARAALTVGPPDADTAVSVEAYWTSVVEMIRRHLEHAQMREQVRADLDPGAAAAVLLGQLNGELARVAFGRGQAEVETYINLTRCSLAPPTRRAPSPRARRAKEPAGEQQQLL